MTLHDNKSKKHCQMSKWGVKRFVHHLLVITMHETEALRLTLCMHKIQSQPGQSSKVLILQPVGISGRITLTRNGWIDHQHLG